MLKHACMACGYQREAMARSIQRKAPAVLDADSRKTPTGARLDECLRYCG